MRLGKPSGKSLIVCPAAFEENANKRVAYNQREVFGRRTAQRQIAFCIPTSEERSFPIVSQRSLGTINLPYGQDSEITDSPTGDDGTETPRGQPEPAERQMPARVQL